MSWVRRFRLIGMSALVMLLALVFTAGSSLEARGVEDPPVLDKFIYLPMVSSPSTTIVGRVMIGVVPAANIEVLLTGNQDSEFQHTDESGNYRFSGINPLQSGNFYLIQYRLQRGNTLWFWESGRITELNKGGYVVMPIIDVANVIQVEPENNAVVTLPYTFRWTPRPGNADETYRFVVYDLISNKKFFSGNVGYSGAYTLRPEDLAGFSPSSIFAWYVRIEKADGSYGDSDGRRVQLTVP